MLFNNCPCTFRISEHEESHRDQARGLSLSQLRTKYLEEENTTLQQRIDSLTRQKQNLDRIVREYQTERHKEVKIFKRFFLHNILDMFWIPP